MSAKRYILNMSFGVFHPSLDVEMQVIACSCTMSREIAGKSIAKAAAVWGAAITAAPAMIYPPPSCFEIGILLCIIIATSNLWARRGYHTSTIATSKQE